MDWNLNQSINFKLGIIRIPFGRYNMIYSPPSQNLGSIPLTNNYLIPTTWSEPALSLYGRYNLGNIITVKYDFALSNGLKQGAFSNKIGNYEGLQEINEDNNSDKQWSARIVLSPKQNIDIISLYFGISGLIGRYDDDKKHEYKALAFDFFLRIGPFSLIGDHDKLELTVEYNTFLVEKSLVILQNFPDTVSKMSSYYIQFAYIFFPESWRETYYIFNEESSFALCLRYDELDLDKSTKGISQYDDQSIYTLGLNFKPIKKTIFRFEYSIIREIMQQNREWNNRFLFSFATHF